MTTPERILPLSPFSDRIAYLALPTPGHSRVATALLWIVELAVLVRTGVVDRLIARRSASAEGK
ncbi:hypothetical protein U4E84_11215 [Halorubrum sp. AD140]|uniref:hypothetical protein n=1 Tax=Halorubrum sp. AD140 TaxID=3050073 RepID=UPI002ACCE821|nr:hypothetical protein [Halorubrum sp. AD140]MDZ5811911.1 hypothetical protein [Halorubrum sp. AD140]